MTKYEYYKQLQAHGLFDAGIALGVIPVEAASHMAICEAYLASENRRVFYRNAGFHLHARHVSRVIKIMGLR